MVAKIIPEERTCLVCPSTFLVGGQGRGSRSKKYCSPECARRAGYSRGGVLAEDLTVPQQAYLAGMIDADGHIGIYNRATAKGCGARLRLSVSNTDTTLLEWIQATTGIGSIVPKDKGNARCKPTYEWVTSAEAAASVLKQVIPYMIVKRARAELAIEYQVGLSDPINRADVESRERYRAEMLRLNKRGPVAK